MINRIKERCQKIGALILDYLKWVYHDGISWKMVERYKIDDINKKIMIHNWSILILISGLIVFVAEFLIVYSDLQKNQGLVLGVLVIFLFFMMGLLGVFTDIQKQNSELYVKSCQSIFQYPDHLSNVEHSAIIYIHYEKAITDEGISDCIALLIEGFRKNKIPYKVYHVFKPEDFEAVFYDDPVTDLWILGHGDQGGFSYGKKRFKEDYFCYSNLKKMPPKKFIAQLHCNCGEGDSLVSINQPKEGFVTEHILSLTQIRCYIITKLRGLDQMQIPLATVSASPA